jgi:hypothetical protein
MRYITRLASGAVSTAFVLLAAAPNPSNNTAKDRMTAASAAIQTGDDTEFVGPFQSWKNAKTDYGAVGNGIADDTAAIQACINALDGTNLSAPKVCYLPAGTYKITSTLQFSGTSKINVAFIGADPATTTIKWYGAAGGDMMYLNAARYSRWMRITWDGSGTAGTAYNHGWDGKTCCAATAMEHADEVFKDLQYGIRGGTYIVNGQHPYMDAEMSIVRDKFYRCSVACVSIESGNALDYWIRDSYFEDSRLGVTTECCNGGNFHVHTSVFRNSSYADMSIWHEAPFGIRNNTSINSKKFFIAKAAAVSEVNMQANQIITPQDSQAILFQNYGALVMIDNKFQSRPGAAAPVVNMSPTQYAQLVSVGNTWTVANPISVTGANPSSWIQDDTVNPFLSLTVPTLPPTPPNLGRRIIEVPSGSNTAAIQNAIDTAAGYNDRTVVHLTGNYTITSTLNIPGGKELQIIGDTRSTSVGCGAGVKTAFLLQSPNRAVLSDFKIVCSGGAAIQINSEDVAGSRVFSHQSFVVNSTGNSVLAENLNYTNVYLQDTLMYPNNVGQYDTLVNGGGLNGGRVLLEGGLSNPNSSGTGPMYHVQNGGRLVVLDRWNEGTGPQSINLTNTSGYLTVSGAELTPYINTPGPSVTVNNFTGNLAIVSSLTFKNWSITTTAGANILMLGNQHNQGEPILSGSGGSVEQIASTRTVSNWVPATQHGYDPVFTRNMLAQLRGETLLSGLPSVAAGVTNVEMFRLEINSAAIGMRFSH